MNGIVAEERHVENERTHVSYSQIQTYMICPQKYYYNYILKVPVEATPEALVFGKHIHFAVAEFYRHWQKTGAKMPLDGVKEAFAEGWKEDPAEIAYKNGNTRESVQEQAFAMLGIFHTEREPGEVIAVESSFNVPLIDAETGEVLEKTLAGTVDLVEKEGSGDVVLVELKTSARAYSPGQIEYSLQPSLYLYALWQMEFLEHGAAGRIRYDVLIKTKQPKFQSLYADRTQRDVHKAINIIKEITRAIEFGIFYRNQGWQCGDCQFRSVCE